jgi:hypothetical protein
VTAQPPTSYGTVRKIPHRHKKFCFTAATEFLLATAASSIEHRMGTAVRRKFLLLNVFPPGVRYLEEYSFKGDDRLTGGIVLSL